jgi:glycosyltransferase involved in cell wall biosynthesis
MIVSPKVSVIVAVFKAVKTLRRCLDSIRNQTMIEWECILIDDGSTDDSGRMCDDYANADERFRVIHKQNEGVAIARQTGIDAARGTYVIHADADDWVDPDWLTLLVQKIEIEKADMVICDYERIFTDRSERCKGCVDTLENEDLLECLLNGRIWGVCWNKMIRRDCFERFQVNFHPQMTYWEDLYVICSLVVKGINFTYVPNVLYHYDCSLNGNGLTTHHQESHFHSMMFFIDTFSPLLSANRYDEGWYYLKKEVVHWAFMLGLYYYDFSELYPEIHERYIKESHQLAWYSRERYIAWCFQGNQKLGVFFYRLQTTLIKIGNFFTLNAIKTG